MTDDRYLFYKSMIFNGLDEKKVDALFNLCKIVTLAKDDYLMREGTRGDEIFFLLEGSLEVEKNDPKFGKTQVIDSLKPGDIVGEMALFDQEFRSAGVKASAPSRLLSLSVRDCRQFISQHSEFQSIYFQLFKNIGLRLRNTTEIALAALRDKVMEYQTRTQIGTFLVMLVTIICLFAYALGDLKILLGQVANSFFITLPISFAFLFITIGYVRLFTTLSPVDVGITLKDWKKSLFDGLFWPIPLILLSILVKYLLIHNTVLYSHSTLFDPYNVMNPAYRFISFWLLINICYALFVASTQEFIARGVLQNLFEKLLVSNNAKWVSIIMSNLIFSTTHLFFSVNVGIAAFVGGIFLGWIFSRTHNLIGCWVAHIILGTWIFCVLGILPNS